MLAEAKVRIGSSNPRLARLLEIQAPVIVWGVHKLQAQLPACAPFMPAPNQNGLRNVLVHQVNQIQLLSYGKSLWHHCKATIGANVDRPAFRRMPGTSFFPLHGHRDARVYPLSSPQLLHS
jgi:hypothetical protein